VNGGVSLFCFTGILQSQPGRDYQRLTELVAHHRIGGLIFATNPFELIGSPILEQPGIHRVAIMGEKTYPNIPAVSPNGRSFLQRALAFCRERGRRRLAIVFSGNDLVEQAPGWANEHGLELPPHWMIRVGPQFPETARDVMRLLFAPGQSERPDALIITDDHLVEEAAAGLLAAGARVPAEVEVVGHANFPNPPRPVVPVTLLGCDVPELLQACVRLCGRLRRGEPCPDVTDFDAKFAWELANGQTGTQAPNRKPLEVA
jgi:DNA-binding LacI/PurR family transcriptional regulator